MSIYTIYKATNIINDKCYIGFDSNWPIRQKQHIKTKNIYKTFFSKAIKKYNEKNFIWEILYQSKEKNYTLNVMETFFIKEHNSFYKNKKGYNMTLGGEGMLCGFLTKKTRNKISNSHKGKIFSDETKQKMSLAKKGKINKQFYKLISEESKEKSRKSKQTKEYSYKMSKIHKGIPKSVECRKKMSIAKTGTHHTKEQIEKANASRKKNFFKK